MKQRSERTERQRRSRQRRIARRHVHKDNTGRLRKAMPSRGMAPFVIAASSYLAWRLEVAEPWIGLPVHDMTEIEAWLQMMPAVTSPQFQNAAREIFGEARARRQQVSRELGIETSAGKDSARWPFETSLWDELHKQWILSGLPAHANPVTPIAAVHLARPVPAAPRSSVTRLVPRRTVEMLSAATGPKHFDRIAAVLAVALHARTDKARFGLRSECRVPLDEIGQRLLPASAHGSKRRQAIESVLEAFQRLSENDPARRVVCPIVREGEAVFETQASLDHSGAFAPPVNIDALLATCRRSPLAALVYLQGSMHWARHGTWDGGKRKRIFDASGNALPGFEPLLAGDIIAGCNMQGRYDHLLRDIRKAITLIDPAFAVIRPARPPKSARGRSRQDSAWHFQPSVPRYVKIHPSPL